MSLAPAPSAAAVATDESFYGTLDLGHATQINDDLVRAIRDEIVTIDGTLRATIESVRNEEKSLITLMRECHHARDEMAKHRRDAAEALDSENMTDELRTEFRSQFAAEVAPHVAIVNPSSSDVTEVVTDDDDDDASGMVVTNTNASKSRPFCSHMTFIERKRTEAKNKAMSIHSIQQEIKSTRIKIKTVDDETKQTEQDVIDRKLDRVKMEGERNVEAKRREYEAESQRSRGMTEALQISRANSGKYAQQIADKTNEHLSERSDNASNEMAMASQNEAKGRELKVIEAEEAKLDEELAALSSQLDFMVKQANEFESEQKKSVDMKAEIVVIEREVEDAAKIKDNKAKEADASNTDLQSALVSLDEAKKAVEEANALKLENVLVETDVLVPANVRKVEAIKEKENLAIEVVALQKLVEQTRNANIDAITTSKSEVFAKSNELKEHKLRIDEARADLDDMCKRDAATEATLLNEKKTYEEYMTKFEAATNAEIELLEQLSSSRNDAHEGQLNERRAHNDRLELEQRESVDILKQAKSFLREVNELKMTIETNPLFDKDGEMVVLPDSSMNLLSSQDEPTSVYNEAGSPQPRRSKSARRKLQHGRE